MKRMAALLLLLSAGCATIREIPMSSQVRVEGGAEPIKAVEISNTCWYFLACLPIASGNPERPNANDCVWFRSSVSVENQLKMLQYAADEAGAKGIVNVETMTTDEDCFLLLFVRANAHTSAVLTK